MSSEDVAADVADLIGDAKTFGASENIRHGTYKMLIKRIRAEKIENDKGTHRWAFVEVTPLMSKPNPQSEGDRVDYVSPAQPGTGPLKDDGNNPNPVGSNCALKVDFDGSAGRAAGSNIKDFILGLFNKHSNEITNDDVKSTWRDLSRVRDLQVGDAIGIDHSTGKPILADKAKRGNPMCGAVINLTTMTKKKKTPNDKGAYVTKLLWSCAAPLGTGENTWEEIAKRRAEIEASMDDEEAEESTSVPSAPRTGPINAPQNVQTTAPAAPSRPAPPAPSAPSRPAPPSAVFTPAAPWEPLAGHAGWFWSNPARGGTNDVKSEAELR